MAEESLQQSPEQSLQQSPEQSPQLKFIKSADELLEIKEEKEDGGELKKTLGYGIIFILALNFIFDSSLFYVPPYGVSFAGKASLLSWLLIALIGIYIAMCYGELISLFPSSGGIYEVSKITFGTFTSFIVGWLNWLTGNIGVAISITAGLEVLIPYYSPTAYIIKAIICFATIFFFSYLAKLGKDIGNTLIFYFTLIIIFALAILIIPMIIDIPSLTSHGVLSSHVNFHLFKPFFPNDDGKLNFALILGASFFACTSLFGLSAVSYLSGEVKEPEKTLPKVFKWSMITVAIITLLFIITSFGVLDTKTYTESTSYYSDIVQTTLGSYGSFFVSFLVIIAGILYFSEGLGWILSGPRLIYSIAKDKLFPTSFAKLDPQYQTPVRAIKFQAKTLSLFIIVVYLMYLFPKFFKEVDPFNYFFFLYIFLTLILVVITLLSIPILREHYPEMKRPYKVPFGMILPYIIIAILFLIVVFWIKYDEQGLLVLISAIAALLIGIPIYVLLVIYFDPDVYLKLKRFLIYVNWIYEPFTLSKEVKTEIYGKIGELAGKKVLQYGCLRSKFTIELAAKVGNDGRIFVTDLSDKTILHLIRKLEHKKIQNVDTFHDEHQINRIHPHIPKIDVIISISMLGHIQDLRKVAKEMSALLPDGGRIIFKEEVDQLKFVPNIGWLAQPEKVVEIFKSEGIQINFVYVKRLLWTDMYVFGIKSKYDVPVV